jgi:prepilin peptidase CpaA
LTSSLIAAPLQPAQVWLLVAVALVCAVTDLFRKKVYNAITYPAIVLGFVLQIALYGLPGLWSALAGFAIGFFPAFMLLVLGGMGGGDVKLMGAIGAIAGGVAATEALLLGVLFGAFIGLGQLAWHGVLLKSLWRQTKMIVGLIVPSVRPKGPIPPELKHELRFGVALAAGTLVTLYDLKTGLLAGLLA